MAGEREIELDPDFPDVDIEGGYYSSSEYTESLRSTVNDFIYENGRRYHMYYGIDKFPHPNDETEQDRLDMHHEVFRLILEGLHRAPVQNPGRILDIGTGTGIWAIEMADKYPEAEVIGMDLSPIQPKWVPPNCTFDVDDAELPWVYQPNSFDFIHARNIAQGIGDWPTLMAQIYNCTKPGGWAQLSELACEVKCIDNPDGYLSDEHGLKRVCRMMGDAMAKVGRPWPTKGVLKAHLEQAGFVDVVEECYPQPLGTWPKDQRMKRVGAMAYMLTEGTLEAYTMAVFTRVLKIDQDGVTKLAHEGFEALRNHRDHTYNEYFVAWGRKPTDGKEGDTASLCSSNLSIRGA